jgi:hypothetical protein
MYYSSPPFLLHALPIASSFTLFKLYYYCHHHHYHLRRHQSQTSLWTGCVIIWEDNYRIHFCVFSDTSRIAVLLPVA